MKEPQHNSILIQTATLLNIKLIVSKVPKFLFIHLF